MTLMIKNHQKGICLFVTYPKYDSVKDYNCKTGLLSDHSGLCDRLDCLSYRFDRHGQRKPDMSPAQ